MTKFHTTRFVPIQDINGYISSLRLTGDYTEDQLEQIRQKHTQNRPVKPPPTPKWENPVRFLDQVMVKMSVQGCKVRVKLSVPFEEMIPYTYNAQGPIPLAVRVRCFMRAGCPDELIKNIIKKHNDYFKPEHLAKRQNDLDRIFGPRPVQKVLKCVVKKKPIPT